MGIWLFAVALVVALALLCLVDSWLGVLLAFAWAFVIVPHGARRLARGTRLQLGEDVQTDYWRIAPPR